MAEHDLGDAIHIFAEAIGVPGARRFRLQITGSMGSAASVWMEKEQLAALGEGIETVLRDEGYQYQRLPLDDAEPPAVFPSAPDIDFRAGRLSLGLDRSRERLVVIAATGEEGGDEVQCAVDYRRSHELRRQIAEVVSAGRPICRLCGGAIDPDGHVCVKTNGHHRQS